MTELFISPETLLLLAALPIFGLLWFFAALRRKTLLAKLISEQNAKQLIKRRSIKLRTITNICLSIAFILLIIAAARPVWGTKSVSQPDAGRDLIFMLDVSQSMLAQDQPPNRLEYAKKSILQCLDSVQSGRAALVAFAGSTSIKCPLTTDFNFLRHTLDDLAPDSVSIGGTRLGDAISKTLTKLANSSSNEVCDLILITDGESHTPINTNAVRQFADSGINAIIIGLGSATKPATIPIRRNNASKPLKKDGQIVYTRQDSKRLQTIADMIPSAVYINAGTSPIDLADIYRQHTTLETPHGQKQIERPIEHYRIFLLLALLSLLAAFHPQLHGNPIKTAHTTHLTIITLLLLSSSSAIAKSRTRLFNDGIKAYKNQDFVKAAKNFDAALNKKNAPEISFNLGNAYYRIGDMQNAARNFLDAAQSANTPEISANASYNAGNAFFMLALHTPGMTRESSIENTLNAIAAYQNALAIQPDHKDAAANLATSQKLLTMLRQSNNNQNNQPDSDSDSQNDENDDQDKNCNQNKNCSAQKSDDDNDRELKPPNLTPDDIIREENKNNLTRSRKRHADFDKVKMNW